MSSVQDPPTDTHGAQVPLSQLKLSEQHSRSAVQEPPIERHEAQVPLSQLPLQHCVSFLQRLPLRLQPRGSAAASPMPRDASVLPTSAAPINLSALRRDISPLASPLVSASKDLSLVSL
jgi:hypothetical protein